MPLNPALRSHRTTILVVDDDPLFLEVAGSRLTNAGYDVKSASTGAECISVLSGNRIDLLILDCGLSEPNELAILDRLGRGVDRCTVMILSSRSGEWHECIMKLYGAKSVVSKPIDARRLLAIVSQVLNAGNLRHG